MAVRKDPLDSGKQRIQEGLTKLLELTEPLDAYRERLRSQIRHVDQKKDVCRHRVSSSFSRIADLIRAKEQEMLQLLDDACDEVKSNVGDKLRETASVSEATSQRPYGGALLEYSIRAWFSNFQRDYQGNSDCDRHMIIAWIGVCNSASASASALLEVTDKQAFCTQFSATSQKLQCCLDSLLLFGLDIPLPKDELEAEPISQFEIVEKEAAELCQRVMDMLIQGGDEGSRPKSDTVSGVEEKNENSHEDKECKQEAKAVSTQQSSQVFTFSETKVTSSSAVNRKLAQPVEKTPYSATNGHRDQVKKPTLKWNWQTTGDPMFVCQNTMSNSVVSPWSPVVMPVLSVPQSPVAAGLRPLPVTKGSSMQVVVTEALSPSHFWIQQGGQSLDQLMARLRIHCSVQPPIVPGQPVWCPNVGTICAARYSADRQWYRAYVISITPPASNVLLRRVFVLYVDYGNQEDVSVHDIQPLDQQFLDLPAQAMVCSLSGVQPVGPDLNVWSNDARSWFVQAIARQTLLASVVKPATEQGEITLVDLYLIWGAHKLNIGTMMVKSGHAVAATGFACLGQQTLTTSFPQIHTTEAAPIMCFRGEDNDKSHGAGVPATTDVSFKSQSKSSTPTGQVSSSSGLKSSRKIAVGRRRRSSSSSSNSQGGKIQTSSNTSLVSDKYDEVFDTASTESPRLSLHGLTARSFTAPSVSCEEVADLQVMVSHVQNPGRFYVHVIGKQLKQFDTLMCQLNEHCSREVVAPLMYPKLDQPCAVMYRDDTRWCRAVTVGIQSGEVCVNYVDYGNREWVSPSDIYPLPDQFLDLPKQAVECTLADVCPHEETPVGSALSEDESEQDYEWLAYMVAGPGSKQTCRRRTLNLSATWQKAASELFEKLTADFRVLYAKVQPSKRARCKARSPRSNSTASSPGLKRGSNSSPVLRQSSSTSDELDPVLRLHLYDTSSKSDVYINQLLVDAGLADSWTLKPRIETTNQESEKCDEYEAKQGLELVAVGSPTLEDVFRDWDPMKAEHESIRNTYRLNPDDTNVALHGYANLEDKHKDICYLHTQGLCRRGNTCQYRHVINDNIGAAFWSNNLVSLPIIGSWIPVVVTAVTHPHLFWVQFPQGSDGLDEQSNEKNGENLAELSDVLQTFGNSKSQFSHDVIDVAVGEWVCARSQQDSRWYRAVVIDGSKADGVVKIFWVDYGDCEYISEDCLLPMQKEFQHLPFQSVECHLAGVEPCEAEWSQDARELFHQSTVGKLLCAHVLFRLPGKLFISLYNTCSDDEDIDIGKLLIAAGVARAGNTVATDWSENRSRTLPG